MIKKNMLSDLGVYLPGQVYLNGPMVQKWAQGGAQWVIRELL